jgi:hypothetical protein
MNLRRLLYLAALLLPVATVTAAPDAPQAASAAGSVPANPAPVNTAAASTASTGTTAISAEPNLPVTTRKQTVTVSGDFPTVPVKVKLRSGKPRDQDIPVDATVGCEKKCITFTVPDLPATSANDFLVLVDAGSQELAVPGELRIQPDELAKVTLDSIAPATDYLSDGSEGFDFVMSGQNLARVATDNVVIAVGYGPLDMGSADECATRAAMNKAKKICLTYDPGMEGQKLNVLNYRPRRYEGPASFQVKVGNNISTAQKITFSGLRAETLRFVAIGVFVVLAAIVFALVIRGIRQNQLAGESYSPIAAFFLDRQTNSYSLSKFQVIAWTTVSIFGFVYLFLCRAYVQWNFTFPPIPQGLPTLLGVSAGTTVAAAGITVNHGSKGAGPIHPSMADFISTGGMIAGERFQFFVWTVVGCLGFLAIILSSDPASLTQLPDVNGTFLTLMGISSAGYLAGKLVRSPGPIIQLLTISEITPAAPPNHAIMKLEVKGQNMSDQAVLKVDDKELGPLQYSIVGTQKQDQPANNPYYSTVLVTLTADNYLAGSHVLYLVNDDGQSAAESFPLNPLSLDPIPLVKAGQDPITVHLIGENFSSGFHGKWVDASGASSTIPDNVIKYIDENHLDVTFVPGAAGAGRLILETPAKLLGIVNIKVS